MAEREPPSWLLAEIRTALAGIDDAELARMSPAERRLVESTRAAVRTYDGELAAAQGRCGSCGHTDHWHVVAPVQRQPGQQHGRLWCEFDGCVCMAFFGLRDALQLGELRGAKAEQVLVDEASRFDATGELDPPPHRGGQGG